MILGVLIEARPFCLWSARSGQDVRAGPSNGRGPLVRSSQPVQEGPPSSLCRGGPSSCPHPRSILLPGAPTSSIRTIGVHSFRTADRGGRAWLTLRYPINGSDDRWRQQLL